MNLFSLTTGPLTAIFCLIALIFITSLLLNRETHIINKYLNSFALSGAVLFSIETYVVTIGLIPPHQYVQGQADLTNQMLLDDWVSRASVNMSDLLFAWLLTCTSIFAVYFVQGNRATTASVQPLTAKYQTLFYNHFGTTGALGVVITSMIYIFILIPGFFEQQLMILDKLLFRGPIPYIIMGLFIWVIINIILLSYSMISQRQLDRKISNILISDQPDKWYTIRHISQTSILSARLQEFCHANQSEPLDHSQFMQLIDQQALMEREKVSISISYLHTAMWAIPVLGFLGTVWGIAGAVANLIPLLKGLSASALGGSQLAESLAGLGVAFDTTLVALSLSLPAMALISLLEKIAHEDMLLRDKILFNYAKTLETP